MKGYVCIDIGGTSIKYGLADEKGNLLERGERPTLAVEEGARGIVEKVIGIVKGFQASRDIQGAAIATAGIVDAAAGSIIFAGERSFPGYTGTKLRSEVEKACGIPCTVENDVNAAGLGEYWLGAAKGVGSVFMMAVGTGIGGCILLNGKVVHGIGGSAGEVGFLPMPGGKILEEMASTRALVEHAAAACGMRPSELSGEKVFQMAEDGRKEALEAIDDMAEHLAEGMAYVCCLLNPEIILLGGAVMAQEKWLRPRLESRLEKLVLPAMRRGTRIEFAHLGNDAGMLGALYFLLNQKEA